MADELIVMYNEETGLWEQKPEPFAVVEYPTEEDFEYLKMVLDFHKKHSWVSVKDRLPKETGEYLTWNGVGVNQNYYAPDLNYNNGFNNPYPVTHWMPLPEPPEGE